MVNQLIKECNLNVGYIENIKKSLTNLSLSSEVVLFRSCILQTASIVKDLLNLLTLVKLLLENSFGYVFCCLPKGEDSVVHKRAMNVPGVGWIMVIQMGYPGVGWVKVGWGGVWWGGSCRGEMDYTVVWWGGSCRGEMDYTVMGWVHVVWGRSCRNGLCNVYLRMTLRKSSNSCTVLPPLSLE